MLFLPSPQKLRTWGEETARARERRASPNSRHDVCPLGGWTGTAGAQAQPQPYGARLTHCGPHGDSQPCSWEEASDTEAEPSWGHQREQGTLFYCTDFQTLVLPSSLRTPDRMSRTSERRIDRHPSPHPSSQEGKGISFFFFFPPLKGIVGLSLKCLQKKKL